MWLAASLLVANAWKRAPGDDLITYEAFEFVISRVNFMRENCEHLAIAPLAASDFLVTDSDFEVHDLYVAYRLTIAGVQARNLRFEARVTRQRTARDVAVFQLTHVAPAPCMLGSEIDDANIETGDSSEFAIKAKEVALVLLNKERGTLCPDRPALQFLTTLAASVQVVQGYFVRLILELREASETFAEMAFTADIAIVYTLDADVPGQTTVSPVIYPADPPCQMMFRIPSKNDPTIKHKGQRRLDFTNRTAIHARGLAASATALGPLQPAPVKELDKLTALASADPPRLRRQPHRGQNETLENDAVNTTLSLDLAGMLSVGSKFIVRPPVKKFVEANLDIPDNYDPRIARTLCFPRGINRRQGSCLELGFRGNVCRWFPTVFAEFEAQQLPHGAEFLLSARARLVRS
jgi:hypothetical protein